MLITFKLASARFPSVPETKPPRFPWFLLHTEEGGKNFRVALAPVHYSDDMVDYLVVTLDLVTLITLAL